MLSEDESGPAMPTRAGHTEYLLRRAFRRGVATNAALMPAGRQPRDLGILLVVCHAGPRSQQHVGELLGINRSIMVKLVDGLERDGLLERTRNPADRRNYALQVTEQGRTAAADMSQCLVKGETELTAPLTQAEARRLAGLLRRIAPPAATGIPSWVTELIGYLLPRAYQQARAWMLEPLAEFRITPRDLSVLNALAGIAPCSQQQLAAALGITGPAVVAVLAGLESRGLVTRRRNPQDRREHVLELTPAGHDTLSRLDRAQDKLVDAVGTDDLADLHRLLARLVSG